MYEKVTKTCSRLSMCTPGIEKKLYMCLPFPLLNFWPRRPHDSVRTYVKLFSRSNAFYAFKKGLCPLKKIFNRRKCWRIKGLSIGTTHTPPPFSFYTTFNPGFLASYWSAGFGRFLQVSFFASHWLEDCANFTPMPEENDHYSANHS